MKNCHLLRHKIATFTFLSLMALEASTGWATTIQGNLEVKARSGSDTANGNLTVKGNTTLKGNTILGNQASDTITINGSITANDDLTVDGDLKIQSVDSDSNGVVINIDDSDNKIPTTQAVKDYIDSGTHSLYLPNEYAFRIAIRNPTLSFWSLTTTNSDENNVSKRIDPGKRLVATVNLQQPQGKSNRPINGELILSSVECKNFDNTKRVDPEQNGYAYTNDINHREVIVLTYVNTGDTPETLYFCGFFSELDYAHGESDIYNLTQAHIAIH